MGVPSLTPLTTTGIGWGMDLSADGQPEMMHGGATVEWDTVTALAAPLTLPDGTVLAIGTKVLVPGQVLVGITTGGSIRMFGPFDPAAADGREATIVGRDDIGLIRTPVVYDPTSSRRFYDTFIGLIIGGPVKKAMVRATTGTASLANGPTLANLRTARPRLIFVDNLRGAHT